MEQKNIVARFYSLIELINNYSKDNFWSRYRNDFKKQILDLCKEIVEIEKLKDSNIIETIIELYEILQTSNNHEKAIDIIKQNNIKETLETYITKTSKSCYGQLYVDYENYNIKTILYYENTTRGSTIAYMAGSFYTDQEYRTFLANIQKGKNRLRYLPVHIENGGEYDLQTVKDGYISRVAKARNSNTQDGYHADFVLNNGRFFLLKKNDNPVDIVFNWITKNTQAGVLKEWKTYLYNTLSQNGHIIMCKGYNYTNMELEGLVLSEEIDTELIRQLRKEGMDLGEISIPREPVVLDPSMSFIDAMTQFIIPHITEKKHLYNVGEEISKYIETPIIYKKGNKLKKTFLFPRQKVMAQGMLNAIKEGRNSLILNGGMGVGKTYISIKLAYATIREYFKSDSGRIAIYAQGHLIPKWQRQFSEALPDVPLKFIKINNYKDVMNLEDKKPEGIEVYLLPKDKVKRKYLEEFASITRHKLSNKFYDKFTETVDKEKTGNIIIANEIKPSEFKLYARRLQNRLNQWICVAKEVYNDEGNVIGYKIATTSKYLKTIYRTTNLYYDFYVDSLEDILKHKEKLDKEIIKLSKNVYGSFITCPCCGGLIYDKEEEQLSEDDIDNYLKSNPTRKSERNKRCTNYIKVDGTPLTKYERNLLIKGELDYLVDDGDIPYISSDDTPITDHETLQAIKQGRCEERYTIVLKRCNSPLWTAQDRKGYRTVNSIDMLKRRFGKGFFLCQISDESHLYSAESSQGQSFAKLCNMSKVNIALTGTLTGGKASHMFYTLYRMIPHKMSKYFKYNEITKFIDHYGRRKKVTKDYKSDGAYNQSGDKVTSSGWNEIPGISPMLYSHFLSDIMISRKIEDMGFDMPELKYYKQDIKMAPELQEGYDKLKNDIIRFMKENKDLNLGGTYLNALLSYPDMPLTEPLMYDDMLISNPKPIDIDNIILPKEQKLIETIKRELQQKRRCVVYVTYTGEKEVDKRVEKILKKAGIKVALLKSSVNTEKREKWIDDRYKEGVEVIICNPKLVQTGLDIIGYPTLIFFQLDYDVRIVRQAESRAWRVGQENTCKVIYMYYEDSLQYDALKLIGSKKKASLVLEGVFAEDILSLSGDDLGDSGATALYKSLLGKVKLKEDDLDFFSEEEVIEMIDDQIDIKNIEEGAIEEIQLSLFTITKEALESTKKKTKKETIIGQISLFEI